MQNINQKMIDLSINKIQGKAVRTVTQEESKYVIDTAVNILGYTPSGKEIKYSKHGKNTAYKLTLTKKLSTGSTASYKKNHVDMISFDEFKNIVENMNEPIATIKPEPIIFVKSKRNTSKPITFEEFESHTREVDKEAQLEIKLPSGKLVSITGVTFSRTIGNARKNDPKITLTTD